MARRGRPLSLMSFDEAARTNRRRAAAQKGQHCKQACDVAKKTLHRTCSDVCLQIGKRAQPASHRKTPFLLQNTRCCSFAQELLLPPVAPRQRRTRQRERANVRRFDSRRIKESIAACRRAHNLSCRCRAHLLPGPDDLGRAIEHCGQPAHRWASSSWGASSCAPGRFS
jgi:hypothetical protein